MIKKIVIGGVTLLACLAMIFSCADNKGTIENEYSIYASMEQWLKDNGKSYMLESDAKISDGLYIKIYKNKLGNTQKPDDSAYVKINYRATDLAGNVIVNTYKDEALKLGTFSYFTRYNVPFTFNMSNYYGYYGLTRAHYEALKRMSVGDSVEIYAAPNSGYYYSVDEMYKGYGGTKSINTMISCINMKLEGFVSKGSVMNDMSHSEVSRYADDNNMSYVESGLYMKKLISNSNAADSVRSDSTLTLNYVGRFLDGFVFDTNIADSAQKNNIYLSTKTYGPINYSYNKTDSTNYGGLIHAFKPVIGNMRLGEKVVFVTTPSLAYGKNGSFGTTGTLIYPYSPLVFEFEIIKKVVED